MIDVEKATYQEDPVRAACVQSTGGCVWVIAGLIGFWVAISYIPVSGITEAPTYARTLLYMSIGHHFTDVQDVLNSRSPPPPVF